MPPTLTYPGVYIAEAPSGVHTITGVATSIGAFFGQAAMGPVNAPVQCLSYSDFLRAFGQPVSGAALAQSVQQFFSNGGSNCYVVRLADSAVAAQIALLNIATKPVLQLTASSPGLWGAGLSVTVDYNTPAPDSTFNLQAKYTDSTGSVVQAESFASLSMDPASPRYAVNFITQSSNLLLATAGSTTTTQITAGYSEARALIVAGADLWKDKISSVWPLSDQAGFQISVDGGSWTSVQLSKTALNATADNVATLTYLAGQINTALGGTLVSVTAPDGLLLLTSSANKKNSVQVRTATTADLAGPLMLGVNQGGIESSLYSDLRPVPNGTFFGGQGISGGETGTGEIEPAMDALATANVADITQVTINGVTRPIALTGGGKFAQGAGGPTDFDGIRENLQILANLINSSYPGFQASAVGYRLCVQNLKPGPPPAVDTFSFAGAASVALFVNEFISNVATYSFGLSGGGTYVTQLQSPSDGNPPTQLNYLGNPAMRTGLYALDSVDLFNIMVIPGDGIATEAEWGAIRSAAAIYCQSRRAFLVLDASLAWTKTGLLTATSADVQNFRLGIGGADINCAVYYPRVQINDNGILCYTGASGMIAGVYAATDASSGVWKAPAGTNAALSGVQSLEVILSDAQNGILNPLGVNCLRRMPAGYLVWGARTIAGFDNSGDSDWTYIPIRRTALFLEESLYRGTQWAVFEPNDESLWSQIRMNLGAFMMGLFRQGAFQGSTPAQSYFVKCDSETTTQADINNGIVNIVVGFAPLKPAEFVVITIQQIAGNLS